MIKVVIRHQVVADTDAFRTWFESNYARILVSLLGPTDDAALSAKTEFRQFVSDQVRTFEFGVDVFLEPSTTIELPKLRVAWGVVSDGLGQKAGTFYVWISSNGGAHYDGVDLINHPV
jgi:hypothetical protein